MPSSLLELTRKPIAGRRALLCIPGTYCSPVVFELVNEAAFPEYQLLPLSWMTSAGSWDLPTLGQRVALLIRELQLGPTLLVGHSTGGAIALVAALTDPSLVRGLLLADTGANTQGHGDITSIIQIIEQGPGPDFFQAVMRRSFYYQPSASLVEQLIAYASSVPREAALQALRSQNALDLTDELSKLTMPAIVVHGQHDQARPITHAQWLVKHLPHAHLCLLDSGHTPMVEAVAGYEQTLQRLLSMVETSS